MAGPLRVERDVEVARWVQEALHDLDGTVASTLPPIFDAYARILHPARYDVTTGETDAWGNPRFEEREITWAEAAALVGDRVAESQPHSAWLRRFGEDQLPMPDDRWINAPHLGDIPLPTLTALSELLVDEHGDAEVLVAVWEGSGLNPSSTGMAFFSSEGPLSAADERRVQQEFRAEARASIDSEVSGAIRRGHVLGLPRESQGRGHVLLRGRLDVFRDPVWVESAGLGWKRGWPDDGRTPNLLWPSVPHGAPAWMVATDLDLDVTLVGGSGHLIGRVLAHPVFEAERVRPTDSLFS